MIWGSTLALGLPIVVFLVVTAVDPWGTGKRKLERSVVFSQEKEYVVPPMSRNHAQEILKEIKRVYEQNYRSLFVPRLDREGLDFRERIREFDCAQIALSRVRTDLLVLLNKELSEPDSEIGDLASTVERWNQQMTQAQQQLEGMNPFPKGLRGPTATGSTE